MTNAGVEGCKIQFAGFASQGCYKGTIWVSLELAEDATRICTRAHVACC